MNQTNLMFDPPASRWSDPSTSHEAEHSHTKCGKRATHRDYVRQLVALHPDSTAGELARFARLADLPESLNYHEVVRRLNDLRDKTMTGTNPMRPVVKGEPRECEVRGTRCTTWRLKP